MNHKLIAQWPKTIVWIDSQLKAGKNLIKTSLIGKTGLSMIRKKLKDSFG